MDEKFAEKILGGAKYWDINQAEFLLNPLMRKDESAQLGFSFDENLEEKYKEEVAKFEENENLKNIYLNYDLPMIPVLYKMEKQGVKIMSLSYAYG